MSSRWFNVIDKNAGKTHYAAERGSIRSKGIAGAMITCNDGEQIPESALVRLSTRLNRNRTSIINNEWAQSILDHSGDMAQFVRFKDGSAAILLKPNATRYQLVHELKHFEQWLSDPDSYAILTRLQREEFVFSALQQSNHWHFFSDAERNHSLEYIKYIRKLFGN